MSDSGFGTRDSGLGVKRFSIASTVVAVVALMTALFASQAVRAQQGGAAAPAPASAAAAGPAPRMADGRPDLSGVWWTGGDVGGRGFGGGRGRGGRGGAAPPSFTDLYTPAAAEAAKKLDDDDDPTLKCVPTAFGTLNVSLFDVGAVGQIVATPKFVVMLTETYHGFRLVPTDGRPHRDDVPPSYRGDSVGRWEGDVFVVETKNFTDDTWIWAEGRVSAHSDQLRVVERYRRVDRNTLEIEATIHDPKMLTAPWSVPKQTLVLAPFDQILPLICSSLQDSIRDVVGPAR
jgi:hypothetical protein